MRDLTVLVLLASCTSAACSSGSTEATTDAAGDGGSGGDSGPQVSLPTGTVTLVRYQANCDASFGTPIGATSNQFFRCAVVTVSCPDQGIDDLQAEVALAAQSDGSVGKGVIVTHAGRGGTNFMNDLPQFWFADGWDLAQIAWASEWECPKKSGANCAVDMTPENTRPGIKNAGCRPATLIKWIHDSAQRIGNAPFLTPAHPFCGHGSSGGSGAFWYSLVHYGLAAQLDYAVISASSPFGRIDIGCDPTYASMTTTAACQNISNPPRVPTLNYGGAAGSIDRWSSTTTCTQSPSPADLDLWKRNSIVSQGANFNFPTPVTTYNCLDPNPSNIAPGLGTYVFEQLHANDPQSTRFKAMCVVPNVNGTCQGEQVFDDPTMRQTAVDDMEQNCKPLAR